MASKEQAEQVVKWVRGKYGQDLGADNKRYVDPPVLLLKDEQAETRNANQSLASIRRALLPTELRERRAGGGVFDTPAKIGQLIFNQKLFAGNCGEMCYLSCFMAQKSKARIWMVTIDDPGDHQFCILGDAKPTAKSIAEMSAMGDDSWVLDPWAGIVCRPGEFRQEFIGKMVKWTSRGKRVGLVNAGGTYDWHAPIGEKYLDAQLYSNLTTKSGW